MSWSSHGAFVVLGTDPHVIAACGDRGLSGFAVRDVAQHHRGDNLLPPGFTEVVVGSLVDVGEVVAGLMRANGGAPPEGLAGAITMNEFALGSVSALGHALGFPAVPPDTAARMRDKFLQKQAVAAAGIRTAAARVAIPGSADHLPAWEGPCVVKPLAGAGTELTFKCPTPDRYAAALASVAREAPTPVVVEELVDVGREWLVDGVVQGGEVVFASIGSYGEPLLDLLGSGEVGEAGRVLTTYRVDDDDDPDRAARIRAITAESLRALRYTDGVFHLELLQEPDDGALWFGECAARRGGAMVQEEVWAKHGFSLAGAAVDAALGRPVTPPGPPRPEWVGTTYLHLPPGTILDVPDDSDLLELPFVAAAHVSALVGANPRPRHQHSAHRQGMCVVRAVSFDQLQENLAAARAAFAGLSTVAPTEGTRADVRDFMRRTRSARAERARGQRSPGVTDDGASSEPASDDHVGSSTPAPAR